MMLPSSAEVQATKVGCLSVAGSPFKADTVVCVYQEDFFVCGWQKRPSARTAMTDWEYSNK